jgi:D-serine dehydratase
VKTGKIGPEGADNRMNRETVLEQLQKRQELLWLNPELEQTEAGSVINGYKFIHMKAAQNRFMRFMPYIAKAFPETAAKRGVIESQLIEIPAMKEYMNGEGAGIRGRVFVKDDARLPIAGSVKARGGIHEVLKIAETLGQQAGLLHPLDDYAKIDSEEFKAFYGQYTIQVGSTGNLGISIGRTAARMGFQAVVHMSSDARQWKKDLLRSKGVEVIEYEDDYSKAVLEGRRDSDRDPSSYFVDDEYSVPLFLGYAVAAARTKKQLEEKGVTVDADHPMIIYVPCGVGGAPGGICYGFKRLFKDSVHVFFCEPTLFPSVLLGMATDMHNAVNVNDFGLSEMSEADGLACASPSGFVTRIDRNLLSGDFTIVDGRLYDYMRMLKKTEDILIEPSSCAAFIGPARLQEYESGKAYLHLHGLTPEKLENSVQICWATGGRLVPEDIWEKYMNTHIEY